tara:strand:+ start:17 stop:160 length:144 start_codon:yes stop_codon:yes gene_type:complete
MGVIGIDVPIVDYIYQKLIVHFGKRSSCETKKETDLRHKSLEKWVGL